MDAGGGAAATRAPRLSERTWRIIAAIEVVLATAAVALDLLLPTLVLLAMAAVSLLGRRQGLGSLGLVRVPRLGVLALQMLAFAAIWTVVQLALVMPVVNHLSGDRQDLSDFADLQGDVGMLLGLLLVSWTLAALGEELAYRGYVLTRVREVCGEGTVGVVLSVLVSSLLFGLAHTEQGVVGVVITAVDAVAFAVLRYRFRTVWASVFAHGFNNTIGLVGFFLVGTTHGLW